jgi:hypothetical protein
MTKKDGKLDESYEMSTISFDDWKKEFDEWEEHRPRILKWIDSWNGGSLLGSRPTYTLTHPLKALEEIVRQIKWAKQRVFRSWDDRVCWSIDQHLSEMIPQWVRQLKKVRHGVPGIMFQKEDYDKDGYNLSNKMVDKRGKEFDEILEKIAKGFESHLKTYDRYDYESDEYKKLQSEFDEGFDLLKKYFETLWD